MNLLYTVDDVVKEFTINNVPTIKDVDGNKIPDDEKILFALKEAHLEVFGYLRNVGIDIDNIVSDTALELRTHILNYTRYKYNATVNSSLKEDSAIMIAYKNSENYLTKVSKGIIVLASSKSKKSGFRFVKLNVY